MLFRCPECGGLNRVPAEAPSGKQPRCGKCKKALDTSGQPHNVDASQFPIALSQKEVPVLIDFWSPSCGPCHMIAPAVDRIARRHAGKLLVLKINGDDNAPLIRHLGIRGYPTFMMWKNGSVVDQIPGAPPERVLAEMVERHV